jgi:hypothetical protein
MTINFQQIFKGLGIALALMPALLPQAAQAAATITIVNGDAAGVGFNDATAVAPVGGNPGTTLGQQRLNAFQEAANIWGAQITSAVPIRILATWEALTCTATSAVLGSAGAISVYRNFPGAIFPGTWYSKALANKLVGSEQDAATADIRARFNINLGNAGCFTGFPFYLGLDNNHGNNVDLVTVLLHEFAHGLGFQTFTNGSTGAQLSGSPSVWDRFILDKTQNLNWFSMTDAQRAASAINPSQVVWTGPLTTAATPGVLTGLPQLALSSPASVAGSYQVGTAIFGPALTAPGVTGQLLPVVDTAGNLGLACNPLTGPNLAVAGKIALIDRGTCTFPVKVKNAQNAGAIGVVIADNAAGSPPAGLGGSDPTIVIPSVRITQADGITLKAALKTRTRTQSGAVATLGLNTSVLAGADNLQRALLYTPNPYQSGSSVSHWDTSMSRNQLMEPTINSDLTHSVITPQDLTLKLLQDIGW